MLLIWLPCLCLTLSQTLSTYSISEESFTNIIFTSLLKIIPIALKFQSSYLNFHDLTPAFFFSLISGCLPFLLSLEPSRILFFKQWFPDFKVSYTNRFYCVDFSKRVIKKYHLLSPSFHKRGVILMPENKMVINSVIQVEWLLPWKDLTLLSFPYWRVRISLWAIKYLRTFVWGTSAVE